jgi:hypothetical protein
VRSLGLNLEPDLSWTVKIVKFLRNGRNALRNFGHILQSPHLNVGVRLLIIKTRIVPKVRLGMEVWLPRTPEETRGAAHLRA